jgi:photosystem II stability/assembly factor-like uncharacterized protein
MPALLAGKGPVGPRPELAGAHRASRIAHALVPIGALLFVACGTSPSGDTTRDAGCCGDAAISGDAATAGDAGLDAMADGSPSAPDAGSSTVMPPPCPGEDSSSDIGVWKEVSPSAFHTPSNMQNWSVAVNPQDESVFAAAGNVTNGGMPPISTGVYKSTDCGATWSLVSTGSHGTDLATGDPWALLVDPVAPATMYVDNGYGDSDTLFQSTNGGVDWAPLDIDPCGVTAPAFSQAVAMDPNNHLHMALTFHETCGATGSKTCNVPLPTTPMCLSQTTDGGQTWSYINGPTSQQGLTGWQEAASLMVLGPMSYLLLTPDNGGWLTLDGGATWKNEIATYNIYGSYAGSAHLAPDGTLYVGVSNMGIYSSRADATHQLGELWTFIVGSPAASGATVFVDDGVDIYMSNGGITNGHPYYWAPLSNTATWTNMAPPTDPAAANEFAYDAARHLIYAASIDAGLWRLHTR